MKKIDNDCLIMCKIQGRIFEKSLIKCNSSSSVFIKRFMNSHVAHSLDDESFLIGSMSDNQAIDTLNQEYPNIYGSEKFSSEEMYWIGYLYRCWAYVYKQRSKDIVKICSPKELKSLYYAYHSLDCINVIERIMEARGIDYCKDRFDKTKEVVLEILQQ